MNNLKSNRRKFLKNSSLGFIGAGLLGKKSFTTPSQEQDDELPKIKEYRTLGRTGFKVSDISTGSLNQSAILKALLKSGVNYIDTSEIYSNGNKEALIGKSIKEFDRKSLFITTKIWLGRGDKSKEYIIDRFRKSLDRLQTDYIDCYMIQAANSSEIVKNEYFHSAISQLKSEGRVRYCGVSCHGESWKGKPKESMEKVLMTAVEDGRFDVLLLVYNFFQQDMGNRILKACKEKNIGTTIMKSNPMFDYSQLRDWITELEQKGEEISEFERWALNGLKVSSDKADSLIKEQNLKSDDELFRDIAIPFVLSNPDVNTVLMGFTNFDNLKYHLKFSGQTLTKSGEKRLINYKETFGQFHCRHACGICEDRCPMEIPVNTIMRYNYYFTVKGQEKYAMQKYKELPGSKPDLCTDCEGFCEKACPHGVLTRPLLAIAHQNLSFNSELYT